MRRLKRNIFLVGKKIDKMEDNKTSVSTWKREQGLNCRKIQIRHEDKVSSAVN